MATLDDKLEVLQARLAALEHRLAEGCADGPDLQQVLRGHARLGTLIEPWRRVKQARAEAAAARELLADPEMVALAETEIAHCACIEAEEIERIKSLLVQADPLSDRPAILEIRAGTGGDEACLFVGDLARMYQMHAQNRGWRVESLSVSEGEQGGFKELVLLVRGVGAYGLLHWESGGHRVQRVPATEAQGRIHTSAATVAVLPEAEEVDLRIAPDDLRIDVFRASGAGGQHVNKTESAVRITHLASGLAVSCQDEKSQHANRERAMTILRARLLAAQRQQAEAERAAARKEQVGSGDRSDRIRTYNFPQNRITDHRIGWTGYCLDRYLDGQLDELQQAMLDDAKARVLDEWRGDY